MPNRLTVDEIISRSLDMVDSADLDRRERPGGTIQANGMARAWFQDALDLFHRAFPWTGTISNPPTTLSITSSTNSYALPSDFTLDVRNGVKIVQTSPRLNRRLNRRSLSWLLSRDATVYNLGEPSDYVIIGTNVLLHPWPQTTYTGNLWYYLLPGVLAPNARPNFPDDWTLVEYVRVRGKEWTGEEERGAAMAYARVIIAELKKSGLGEESENDALELDRARFRPSGSSGFSGSGSGWLGDTVAR